MGPKQRQAIRFKTQLGEKTYKLFELNPESEEYKRLAADIKQDEKKLSEMQKAATLEWLDEKKEQK